MNNIENKQYWEEYVKYWIEKVGEANTDKGKNDKTLSDEVLKFYIKKLDMKSEKIVLDYGCGFCRAYKICENICGHNSYYGIDIAKNPLIKAMEQYPELKERLMECNGVELPYCDNRFDYIICFGVFDACEQQKVLNELLRVLQINGKILITGKNNYYMEDDEEAYIAEINARKKGHPNYFTNTEILEEQLSNWIIQKFYFKYRGDFSNKRYLTKKPKQFYEWMYHIEKKCAENINIKVISDSYSKTWRKRNEFNTANKNAI